MKPKKVFIADDHPCVREGFKKMIETDRSLTVCGEAADPQEALRKIKAMVPDIALVDIEFDHVNCLSLIRDIVSLKPSVPILVITHHDELYMIEDALKAGAKGYFVKTDDPSIIRKAIHDILSGIHFYSRSISSKINDLIVNPKQSTLPKRKTEILRKMGAGLKAKEIADSLHIARKTVEAHMTQMQEKLKQKSREELYEYARHFIGRDDHAFANDADFEQ